MPTSKITVFRNGKTASNIKVTLEYRGLTQSGFTSPAYTNSMGVAIVSHSSTGKANIYINGTLRESMNTPNDKIVHI